GGGIDHALQIVDVDSSDAENRQAHFGMHASNIGEANGRVVRFCGRGEDWAESDIIRPFALCPARLLKTVRGFSDQNVAPRFASRELDRIVMLTDVHPFNGHPAGDFGVIIDNQWRGWFSS